jgi:hypoxanthine-DNA glycosylase
MPRPERDRVSADDRLIGLAPVVNEHTRLVVLGSFPGAASLAAQQYYAHPRNQFWPIVSTLLGIDLTALPYAQRLQVMLVQGLGLWDVYASCRRNGSLDTAIRDAQPNDLAELARRAPRLAAIAHNGGESARAMRETRLLGVAVVQLPSTSPANASWSFQRKLAAWQQVFSMAGIEGRAQP